VAMGDGVCEHSGGNAHPMTTRLPTLHCPNAILLTFWLAVGARSGRHRSVTASGATLPVGASGKERR
jgi:hypothetical protein